MTEILIMFSLFISTLKRESLSKKGRGIGRDWGRGRGMEEKEDWKKLGNAGYLG